MESRHASEGTPLETTNPEAASADSDWELLRRVAEGDSRAFTALVERHQDRLIRLCERLLQDREEALDAAQEVLLKVYRKAGDLRPKGQLFTWIYRVATNHCLNRLRRRKIVRFVSLSRGETESSEAGPARPLEPREGTPGPLAELEAKERWVATRRAIESLPVSQRAVLVLIRFEGLSYRRTAETLGITEGAVESRLFRAMRRLERAVRTKTQDSSAPPVSRSREAAPDGHREGGRR